jgi:predicted amidohydrolase YtcJ
MAVNGLYTPGEDPPDCWAFEEGPPAWIEVELPQGATVEGLELIVGIEADFPVEVFGRGPSDELEPLGAFDFVPTPYGVAVYDFPQPLESLRSIRLDFPEVPPSWCLPELGVMGWQVEKIPPDGIKSPMCLAAPDLIFHNANVITMDAGQPSAEAVAVEGERILAVGADRDLLPGAGCSRTIDLQGQTLMPGLIEGHSHALHFPDRAELTRDEAVDTLLRYGVTTVNELVATQEFIEDLMRMEAEGRLRVRVNAYPNYNAGHLDESGGAIFQQDYYQDNPPTLDLDRKLRIPAVKIFVDGAFVPGRGCMALSEPWPESFRSTDAFMDVCFDDLYGDLYLSQSQLNTAVQDIQSRGYRAAFHAMGDAAIDQVLNAVEAALGGESNRAYRHQIHHSSVLRPDQIERYAEMDLLASVRGYFNTCDQGEYPTWYGSDRKDWAVNRFALADAGVHTFAEGDFGWTADPDDLTQSRTINPFLGVYGLATHRQLRADGTACEPEPWVDVHPMSVEEALRRVTINVAYINSQETVIGSLTPGKFADMIVLSDDPLIMDPNDLPHIEVWMTMVAGQTEYCRSGHEALCP